MQIVTSIWGWSIVVAILGFIPYVIWSIRTAIKKNWKKFGIQIGAPVAYFAILIGISVYSESGAQDQYLKDLYDTDFEFADPVFIEESSRSFNGDGASIYVYEIPDQIRRRFENPDSRLMTEFPKRPHFRSHWSVVIWKKAPFDSNFENYLDFALYASSKHSQEIRDALSREGTFYSFFHYDHGSSPGNVDFFVVDLVGGRIYEINVNT